MKTETYIGYHLLAGVVAMQFAALFIDKKLPYWPIELSRIAASGHYALLIFRATAFTIGPALWVLGETRGVMYGLWFSLVGIAIFEDSGKWLLHMVFVFCMTVMIAMGAFYHSPPHKWHHNLYLVGAALAIYGVRFILRAGALIYFEKLSAPQDLIQRGQQIMYKGARACTAPSAVIPVFQVCGVLQWICFIVFAQIEF